jgi:5-formyltetrahydrofolate cyclo-ligase
MTRDALRAKYRALRTEFAVTKAPPSLWPDDILSICAAAECVGGYWPMGSELSPIGLLSALAAQGVPTALPAFDTRDADMVFRYWKPGNMLERAPWAFEQPCADSPLVVPDALIIPLVAFDRDCNRLGQGGGHYDRYLSRDNNVLKIGFAWSIQECAHLPVAAWDVPMDMIVTECGIVHRRRERIVS